MNIRSLFRVIVVFILILALAGLSYLAYISLFVPIIPREQAIKIAAKAAKPPGDLPGQIKHWEISQTWGSQKPLPQLRHGQLKRVYKFTIYYLHDGLPLKYYGRVVYIDAEKGSILEIAKAKHSNY